MVQRYLLQGGFIGPHLEGDWVGYEDYAALKKLLSDVIDNCNSDWEFPPDVQKRLYAEGLNT